MSYVVVFFLSSELGWAVIVVLSMEVTIKNMDSAVTWPLLHVTTTKYEESRVPD